MVAKCAVLKHLHNMKERKTTEENLKNVGMKKRKHEEKRKSGRFLMKLKEAELSERHLTSLSLYSRDQSAQ